MLRSDKWDAQAVLSGMANKVLRALPPASDGKLFLLGDTTHNPKRGRQHPLGHVTRQSEPSPYTFGFDMVVVVADAGYPANATLKLIEGLEWTCVFAMPRTRKFANGKYVRDLVQHLPKSQYRRRVTYKPDGRRQDYWVFMRHASSTLTLDRYTKGCRAGSRRPSRTSIRTCLATGETAPHRKRAGERELMGI
jgi:hypothetical protein